jgi:Family of unknown function (DUF5519)
MKSLVEQVSAWPGVSCHDHRFGGVEFRVGKREIGHAHSFGVVDIPFTVKIRDGLIRAGRAERHHWLPDSGWTTVRVKGNDLVEHRLGNAAELLRFSHLRIQAKSADDSTSAAAVRELATSPLDSDQPEATGVPAIRASL